MKEEIYEDLNEEELNKFSKVKIEVDENSFEVSEGVCPECNEKMSKYIANFNLFEGALTFHIIKFKCSKCKREYLDMNEAEKYDFYLLMKNQPNILVSNIKTMVQKHPVRN